MNWKKFRNLFISQKKDEACFMIGVDLGNATSAIAYYNTNHDAPEIIDISGGYGKPSVPTVMQYIYDTKEWVFGEYALLNHGEGKDITLGSLMKALGKREYVEIEQRPVSVCSILGLYLKELFSNVKSINPKAEIAGIVAAIPSYLGEGAKEELIQAFNMAGYEKEVIALVPDRECIFSLYYHGKEVSQERVMLLDFGSRELRGGIYSVLPENDECLLRCLSSLFDENLGTDMVERALYKRMTKIYCNHMNLSSEELSKQARDYLKIFVYQHKDLIFQKTQNQVRLYFNFAYPPFQHSLNKSDVNDLIAPLRQLMGKFIENILEKNIDGSGRIEPKEIDAVICTGGGFEMMWAREVIEGMFPDAEMICYRNSKCVVAEGAAVIAAKYLEVIEAPKFITEDLSQIRKDIGLVVTRDRKHKFIPLIERNSFWWQYHESKYIIINSDTSETVDINIFERDANGELHSLGILQLDNMPIRPRGVTRIKVSMQLSAHNEIEATLTDCGFGEMFPAEDYECKFIVRV